MMVTIMPTTSDTILTFSSVKDTKDAEIMRLIRNYCREYMTKDTSFISAERQIEWFDSLDKNTIKMFILNICHHGVAFEPIGFGYARFDGKEAYVTGGLLPEYRDKGYGKTLFLHLVEAAKSFNVPITLEVLNTNVRAKRLYESIGFRDIESDERITKMEYVDD